MKKVIKLTESDLHKIIKESVSKILEEDVLNNNWEDFDNGVLNNYEPFKNQKESDNEHDWGISGEDGFDPTEYDPDAYTSNGDYGWDGSFSDGDLYRSNL